MSECAERVPEAVRPWLIVLMLLCTAAVYFFLHAVYIPTNSDDAWTTSFAYNYFYKGELRDTVFGRPAGTLIAFGYTYGALQKLVLDAFGWTRSNAILLSTFFFFAALPFCWNISRRLGCTPATSLLYVLTLPLWEPLFRIANTARPDACCLFFLCMAFFWALRRHYVFAGIASGIALEIHQMGALAFVLVGVHVAMDVVSSFKAQKSVRDTVGNWLLGAGLGVAYYLFLHLAYLDTVFHAASVMHSWSGNFILAHFFLTSSYRHLPELLFFIFIVWISFSKRIVFLYPEAYLTAFAVFLFSFIFPRPIIYYSAYFFVFMVLITSLVVVRCNRQSMYVIAFLLFVLPQYGYIYYKNKTFSMVSYTEAMKKHVPEDCDIITGPFNAWFAFKEQRFVGYVPAMVPDVARLSRQRPVCYLRRLDHVDCRDVMGKHFMTGQLIKEFDAGGQAFGLYYLYSDP